MPDSRPLLTIAIPTYNRVVYLRELLVELLPQLDGVEDVELLVISNACTDGTVEMLQEMLPAGPRYRLICNDENVGPDANFVRCFHEARGKYLWVCGDDDILRAGTVGCVTKHLRAAEYDMVYVVPEAFFHDWRAEHRADPDGRKAEVVTSARSMILHAGTTLAFVTAVIVNRDRAVAVMEEQPEAFLDTALVHLAWTLPLLARHRKSLILWQRWVAGRTMNSGFDAAEIFGRNFADLATRVLHAKPSLARLLVNLTLRQWFPGMLMDMRVHRESNDDYNLEKALPVLHGLFKKNPRYWIFIYPLLRLPLPLARGWQRVTGYGSRITNLAWQPRVAMNKVKAKLGQRPAGRADGLEC